MGRGDGSVASYEIVAFTNGNDPTQPPVSHAHNDRFKANISSE